MLPAFDSTVLYALDYYGSDTHARTALVKRIRPSYTESTLAVSHFTGQTLVERAGCSQRTFPPNHPLAQSDISIEVFDGVASRSRKIKAARQANFLAELARQLATVS